MKHRFTLTYQTRGTAKQAREDLLNALTSGGLHEPDIRLVAQRKAPKRTSRKRVRPDLYYRIIQ